MTLLKRCYYFLFCIFFLYPTLLLAEYDRYNIDSHYSKKEKVEYFDNYNERYIEKKIPKDSNSINQLKDPSETKFVIHRKKKKIKVDKEYKGYYKVGKPYKVMGQKYKPKEQPDYKEKGISSWYGKKFYGKKTANGEIYNMYDLTAAHRTLPLPSMVRVINLENNRQLIVRVNDRGPFVKNRIIDVSKAAAKELGFHEKGTIKVKVEFLPEETEEMLMELGLR